MFRNHLAKSRPQHNFLSSDDSEFSGQGGWFVYLLPLLDCTAFKVGFSRNPLQRMYAFSHRYFERFDLAQSMLLQIDSCAQARMLEAALKGTFAESRMDAPYWVPIEAGGCTEWFSAVYFPQAEELLRSFLAAHESAKLIAASDFIARELGHLAASFELWALQQAHRLGEDAVSISLGYEPTVSKQSLRDWFDAYRFFGIRLFADDPVVFNFVAGSARLA